MNFLKKKASSKLFIHYISQIACVNLKKKPCLKIVKFYSLSKSRQIHVIKRCQFIDKLDLPTFYWLPKLHKNPYKSRFISNSSHCSTTILSKHITSARTAVKDHVIKYSETAISNSVIN